jgi:DNA-directed RNA polymerase subunit alpha
MIIQTKDFQMPAKVEVEKETLTKTYGKFFAEPFEKGFGTTMGNACRRVLLSSLAGAAVTSIKIEGVHHEFSTLPGVKEDVVDLILNIKQLRLKMMTDTPQTIHFKKKGAGELLGKDIIHSSDIEVLTPNLHIATLDKDANVDMEMTVRVGRGFVPADRHEEEVSIGVIPIDSIFTPIQKVAFSVEKARVGRRTDYDKLIFEVWTDGSVTPENALGISAKILKNHLTLFINFEETEDEVQSKGPRDGSANKDIMMKPVSELELSVRAANCLKNAEIQTIGELISRTESEMLDTKNFGIKSLVEIKELLETMGLSFGMLSKVPSPSEEK